MNAKLLYKIREWHSAIREWDAFVTGPEHILLSESRSVSESFRDIPVRGVVRLPLLRVASRWQALIIAERETSGCFAWIRL